MDEDDLTSVCYNYQLSNRKFFPFPIYLTVANKYKSLCKTNSIVKLTYKKKNVCEFFIRDLFTLKKSKKKQLGELLFNTKNTSHPGFKFFLDEDALFLSGKIKKINKIIFNKFNFSTPIKIKNQLKKTKKVVGFHTRNIPHKGHEWIHEFGLKKCKNILIQPIIGQFKKGEYTEEAVLKSNKFLVKAKNGQIKNNNFKYFFSFINLQPKYGGPREALLHALIRKNYGCTHFLVGRDHAGFKNFYKIYDSQAICKKFENKLKIKILTYKSPKICIKCKVITNQKCDCKNNSNKKLRDINGSFIRKLLKNKKIVPTYMLNKKYYQSLNIKKLIL